jgi:hypothetical protein
VWFRDVRRGTVPDMHRSARATGGQASLEWVAIVAVVAALLAVGTALAQADALGRRVTRQMARALCLVGHGDCRRDQEPCVTRSEHGASSLLLNAFFVRLGSGWDALIEQRSDGTVAVTRVRTGTLGVEGGFGAHAKANVKGVDFGVGGEVRASLLARREGGRAWIVDSWDAAQELLGRLRLLGGGPPRPADIDYGGRDLAAALGASLGADGLVRLDLARGGLTFDRASGARVDRRTGRRTVYVKTSAAAEARLGGGILGAAGAAASRGGEVYSVEFDATGRPIDLQVVAAGTFGGSQDLPDAVQPVVGLLETGAAGGRRFEVTAHLDLTDAGNLAAARALLTALARDRWSASIPAASRVLRRRIDERGTVEARVLESRSDADNLEVSAAVGPKVGGAVHAEHASTRLLAAASRGLDGRWVAREDCVAAA